MKKNVGSADMWIRITIGVIVMALGFFYQSWWGLLAIVPLATAFMQWCPVYLPFGISTAKKETEIK